MQIHALLLYVASEVFSIFRVLFPHASVLHIASNVFLARPGGRSSGRIHTRVAGVDVAGDTGDKIWNQSRWTPASHGETRADSDPRRLRSD